MTDVNGNYMILTYFFQLWSKCLCKMDEIEKEVVEFPVVCYLMTGAV